MNKLRDNILRKVDRINEIFNKWGMVVMFPILCLTMGYFTLRMSLIFNLTIFGWSMFFVWLILGLFVSRSEYVDVLCDVRTGNQKVFKLENIKKEVENGN